MSCFTFNFYLHDITLICKQPGGEVETILSARFALANTMEFVDWEVLDENIFTLTADKGEVQDYLPMGRAKTAAAAAVPEE